MYEIKQVTRDPLQQQTLILPDGTSLTLTLYFVPMQYGWFIRNLTHGDFILNGFRVVISPNMLYQYKNLIPFGLACFSTDSREPSQQDDFASGFAKLYLLNEAEVEQYEDYLSGQVSS